MSNSKQTSLNISMSDELFNTTKDKSTKNVSAINDPVKGLSMTTEALESFTVLANISSHVLNESHLLAEVKDNLKDMVTNISEVVAEDEDSPTYGKNRIVLDKIASNDSSVEDIIIKLNTSDHLFGANGEKTLEEEYLDQKNISLMANESNVEPKGGLNVSTEVIAAMPGYPVFLEPPEFKIHDPDDGPLEPYLRPDNHSSDISLERDQQFVYVKRPEFEADRYGEDNHLHCYAFIFPLYLAISMHKI